LCLFCFFFSSRRRHTRFSRDWSSDVCSSDLPSSEVPPVPPPSGPPGTQEAQWNSLLKTLTPDLKQVLTQKKPGAGEIGALFKKRSEERRVGKEGRSGWTS